jgi:hypothetical protein
MNWLKTVKKALLGFLTFAVAYLATNPAMIDRLIPGDIEKMTIGAGVAALCVALANVLKNWSK